MKDMRFFDFEVTPNWWLCVFGDLHCNELKTFDETIKDTFVCVNSDMPDAREKLLELLRDDEYVKVGYNIKGYDLAIANGIYQGFTPQQVKILNDIIINPACAYSTREHLRIQPFAKKKLSGICYQDLLDDGSGSLKEKEAALGLSVLESSVDFNTVDMTDEDKKDMTYYCKQDVYASMQFYAKVVHSYLLTKLHMGVRFNIPEDVCYKSTNAKLVSLALRAKRKTFDDEEKVEIKLPSKIRDYCYENLPSTIIDRILSSIEGFSTILFDNKVTFGNGGIHSVYKENYAEPPCLYVETTDEYCLVNVDASSYYPSEMIQFNLLSRTVSNPQAFKDIFDERMTLKAKKEREGLTPEEQASQMADKLVLNTTFGASGNKYLDLYDLYMCTSVCRVGQIFLGALANKIYKTIPCAKIIQSNTDGILCYLPKSQLDKLTELQEEWTKISGIVMERDEVLKIWQRDVNNYVMVVKEKGKEKVKRRGAWLNNEYHREGGVTTSTLTAFVCANAILDYLTKGKDIVTSIVSNTNLFDFVITCTKGPSYRGVFQRNADGDVELFRANRVIASKDESLGMLYKYKMYKGNISCAKMPNIPEHCKLVNDDLSHYNFDEIRKELDYMYYISRCADMLDIAWIKLRNNELSETDEFNYFK